MAINIGITRVAAPTRADSRPMANVCVGSYPGCVTNHVRRPRCLVLTLTKFGGSSADRKWAPRVLSC
jgi:hypothetical protein